MATFIQEFENGSITKNTNGTYNFEVKGEVVSTYGTVSELVESQTKPVKKERKNVQTANAAEMDRTPTKKSPSDVKEPKKADK